MPPRYQHCKFLRAGTVCPVGCHDGYWICHHFSNYGECSFKDCKRVHIDRNQNSSEERNGTGYRSEHRRNRYDKREGNGRSHTPPKRPRTAFECVIAQHRETLGLNPDGINVTASLVKAAYKVKCLEHHPDKGGTSADFRKIQEAWEYLSCQMEP